MRLAPRSFAAAALVPALLLALPASASATPGDLGHDISYPQCGTTIPPTTDAFRLVGVTGGRPYDPQPCLADEAVWATGAPERALYVNTNNPGHTSAHWPTAGTGRCVDASVDTDAGCAYEYGRKAATYVLGGTKTTLAGTGLDPLAVTWWLDVEQGNSWVGSGTVNAAVLQGFVDALRSGGVPEVGVYSTSYQWGQITGGYTRATSGSYRAAWKLSPLFPIEDGPVWFAGVGTSTDASSVCTTTSFTGGEKLLSQYADSVAGIDGDYRCADADRVAPTSATTAPAQLVTKTSTLGAAWTGADSGSGLATFDVRLERAPTNGSFQPWLYPGSLQRTALRSAALSSTGQGWTTCVQSRARDVAGNVSGWSGVRCTAVPLDDRALTASAGWTRGTGSGFFASTYTTTTRYGATLVRTGLVSSRLHLLALRCSACGKVAVYVGTTLLGTVNLYASTTSLATIPLPRFSLRSTSVTLKVLTSGRTVRVDGLATSRV